ncbi:MAG TPA: M3 family oligoendopeptidase [Acidimicrobiales bacterium]|nr:M3 family oligoendopeptidase [Acidimicrobiales bacterium]
MSTALPRWDLSGYFPSLGSREFAEQQERLGADVDRLSALYEEHDVRGSSGAILDQAKLQAFESVVAATNELFEELRLLSAYVHAFVSTDARDETAAAVSSELQAKAARVRSLSTRFDAWVAALGADALVAGSVVAADHAFPLRKAERSAAHQMPEGEETLYSELSLTGSTAWSRLHGDVTSLLSAQVEGPDGSIESLPITVVRNLATDADAERRRAAYRAELRAWETVGVPCAAAMNGIKGEANTVNRHRGWADSLEPALHNNAVSRATLGAMQSAVVASLPDWRRYLRAKARLLGSAGANGGLPWWDLFAPVGDPSAAAVAWEEATATVLSSFASYSPALAGLAQRALDERWIDAEARSGKRGGAFCMGTREGESRVLLNFGHTFDSVSTLAHELGHAYHNTTLADRTPMQRATPMALAETASIFCETLLTHSALAATEDPARRLSILEYDLQGGCQVVVDIHSRFLFESAVFERRQARTLSVSEFCELMLDAQRQAYGDGLDESNLHAYMWAVKPHYYSTHYYNWPYTFGLLFGLGLFAVYQDDPERFRSGYDDLLSSTGLGDATELAGRFGIKVEEESFWAASLEVLHRRIDSFEALTAPGSASDGVSG